MKPLAPDRILEAKALRRCILTQLYQFFVIHPYASMELSELSEACASLAKTLNWNLVYLEKSGLLALGRTTDCPPFVACSADITAAGINLVEDPDIFDKRFPEFT